MVELGDIIRDTVGVVCRSVAERLWPTTVWDIGFISCFLFMLAFLGDSGFVDPRPVQ